MAKSKNETPTETAATEAVEAPKIDKRIKNVDVPIGFDPTPNSEVYTPESFLEALKGGSEEHPRRQFIRALAATGNYTRSALTELTRVASGLKADDASLKYQIIFQATSDMPESTWPAKPAKQEAPAESVETTEAA